MTSDRHPMVIDRKTKLARPATQADIDCMEAICLAYDAMIRNFRAQISQSDMLKERLDNAYGR